MASVTASAAHAASSSARDGIGTSRARTPSARATSRWSAVSVVRSGDATKKASPTASGRSPSSAKASAQSSTSIHESGRSPPPKRRTMPLAARRKKTRFSRSPGPMMRGGRPTVTGTRPA